MHLESYVIFIIWHMCCDDCTCANEIEYINLKKVTAICFVKEMKSFGEILNFNTVTKIKHGNGN